MRRECSRLSIDSKTSKRCRVSQFPPTTGLPSAPSNNAKNSTAFPTTNPSFSQVIQTYNLQPTSNKTVSSFHRLLTTRPNTTNLTLS
jgi:hypothetical protein